MTADKGEIEHQTKYRNAVHTALKPYDHYIAAVENLAYWKNPIYTVAAVFAYSIGLTIIVNLINSTTFFSFLAIVSLVSLVAWKVSKTVSLSFIAPAQQQSKIGLEKLVSTTVGLRFGSAKFLRATISKIQAADNKQLIKLLILFVLLAFIGDFFHLSTLIWIAGLGLLIAPGLVERNLHKQAWVFVEPHYNQHWPVVEQKIAPVLAIVNSELRNLIAVDELLAIPFFTIPTQSKESKDDEDFVRVGSEESLSENKENKKDL